MGTKSFSVRLSGENLEEVKAYAAMQGIQESTAIGKLLDEGRKALKGQPITRWAVVDPDSNNYSLALGQLRENSHVLEKSLKALGRPRPKTEAEKNQDEELRASAKTAFALTQNLIKRIYLTGRLANPPADLEKLKAAMKDMPTVSVVWLVLNNYVKN